MIMEISHTVTPINESTKFYKLVADNINMMQVKGLVVEVQYQQSDSGLSALMLGRKT